MTERPKFTKREIRLVSRTQVDTAIAMLSNAPLDALKPLLLTLGEEPKARGLDANGYYFMRIGEIAGQGWINGKQFNSDAWHEYAKRHIMPEEVTTKDGVKRSKWVEQPDGSLTAMSTTKLEKLCFSEYTALVESFGASLGVQFSANPRELI